MRIASRPITRCFTAPRTLCWHRGMTIAGAAACLHFTRLPYFNTMGFPLSIGMVVVVAAALTLGPAVISIVTRFGRILEPKGRKRARGWRRIGAATVRWPGGVLVMAVVLALVGLLALPGYHTTYNDRIFLPDDVPANVGYAAANRHFSEAKMNPELVMVEADHDLRNPPADFLVIDKIAKAMARVHGIAQVQAITRPDGKPIEHASLAYTVSQGGTGQIMSNDYQQKVLENTLKQADDLQVSIDSMERMHSLTLQMADVSRRMADKMRTTSEHTSEVRDHLADFDDFFRPIRSYFYWEPHCYNIPVCWALRSVFDSLDGINTLSEDLEDVVPDIEELATLTPQLAAVLPAQIQTLQNQKQLLLNQYQAQKAQQDHTMAAQENATAMGEAFDAAMNDDTFYLPPEAFETADFQRGIKLFLSPDGHAVRFTVFHQGDPLSEEGTAHIEPLQVAAVDAIKGTPLEGSTVYIGGSAATYQDMQQGADYDLLIAGGRIAAPHLPHHGCAHAGNRRRRRHRRHRGAESWCIVRPLSSDLAAPHRIPLHWMVLPMAVIVLLAVGADYNLLLVSRMKEELRAGLNTGTIRSMAGTGSVVTSAGLVFAFTMMSMAVSNLTVIGQVGTTIGLGLLFDTLVVRSLMTPSLAALFGKWFWWPMHVRQRPLPRPWPTPRTYDDMGGLAGRPRQLTLIPVKKGSIAMNVGRVGGCAMSRVA